MSEKFLSERYYEHQRLVGLAYQICKDNPMLSIVGVFNKLKSQSKIFKAIEKKELRKKRHLKIVDGGK